AVGTGGTILRAERHGTRVSWHLDRSEKGDDLWAVDTVATATGRIAWAVGENGTVLRKRIAANAYVGQPDGWEALPTPPEVKTSTLYAVDFLDEREGWGRVQGYLHVKANYQLLIDNLLDLTHLGYLHGTSIGTTENASTPEELTRRPRFFGSRRVIRNADAPPVMAATGRYSGKIDRTVGMDFYLPGFHAGIGDMLYPQDHPDHPGAIITKSRVYHAVTPATGKSCTYFFAMASPDTDGLDRMFEYLKPVIEEDKFATEEIEKMLALVGENVDELLIGSDRNAVEARRMLQALMDEEAAGMTAENPRKPAVSD
ncbi:MAG: hypothetical protein RIS94_1562, partial [Pseudomonadota bacterium]